MQAPGQVQRRFPEEVPHRTFGEGLGGFGAELDQVQQASGLSGEVSGERSGAGSIK